MTSHLLPASAVLIYTCKSVLVSIQVVLIMFPPNKPCNVVSISMVVCLVLLSDFIGKRNYTNCGQIWLSMNKDLQHSYLLSLRELLLSLWFVHVA
jgi:hypothetical protein